MYIPSISTRPAPTQSVTDAASCTCATACQFRRGPSGGPLPRAPPLQRPVQSCDLRVDPRLREWTSLRGDGLRRRPAQYMAGRADDAHACDVHLTTLPGALRRASAQGPASEAARTTLHPPGGPPPKEEDSAMYISPPNTLSSDNPGGCPRAWWLPTTLMAAHNPVGCPQPWWLPTTLVAAHNPGGCPQPCWLPTTLMAAHNPVCCPQP